MNWSILFFAEAILLGIGLAMDAFSVSLANGLNEPCMRKRKIFAIAGVFAAFQFLMPLIGWGCVHKMAQLFSKFEKLIPWIALVLLCFIGGKMLMEGIKKKDEAEACSCEPIAIGALAVQGIATSIDALSVGFTISEYDLTQALVACLLIGIVTFGICLGGVLIGKKVGTKLSNKASILGGVILIAIGIEIFLTGILG